VAAAHEAGREVRYWQVRNAEHFDAFLGFPDYASRYVPMLPYVYAALDRLAAHLDTGTALPADAVIATTPRGGEPLTATDLAIPRYPGIVHPEQSDGQGAASGQRIRRGGRRLHPLCTFTPGLACLADERPAPAPQALLDAPRVPSRGLVHPRQCLLRHRRGVRRDALPAGGGGPRPAVGHGPDPAGLRVRRAGRAHRAMAQGGLDARPRARFARRRDLLRCRPGG